MERQAKQQKLFHLRTTTSASVREILTLLRLAGGDPELSNIATERTLGTAVERETRDLIAELPLLREDGGWFNCPIVMFDRLLPWLVGKSDKFRNILSRLHQDRPPMPAAPYKLLFYCDEATPGDVLRLDNRRKAMWLYCTIADAQGFLHYDAMWLPLCCIRATMIKALAGGWSAAFSRIMQALFIDDNCLQTGVVVPHVDAGRAALWFFRFGFLLADTQAIQFTLGAKGPAGNSPCPLCANVTNVGNASLSAFDASGVLVDLACPDYHRFARRVSRDLWEAADRLRSAREHMGLGQFRRLQQGLGLTFNERGLLCHEQLRAHVPIAEALLFDPMHVLFNDGECHTEMNLILPK